MSTVVLNDQSRKMPLQALLETASGGRVEVCDERGVLIATLMMAPSDESIRRAISLSEGDLAALRASRASSRDQDISTEELMERMRRLEREHP